MLRTDFNGKILEYHDIDDPFFIQNFPMLKKFSITAMEGAEPTWSLFKSVEYIVKNKIPGDIAECGVWAGGSMLLAAMALIHFGDTSRKIYLYDTFAGMPQPDEVDQRWDGVPILPTWQNHIAAGSTWGYGGTQDMVRTVMKIANYPEDKLIFVEGMVEDTIPGTVPEKISILRLDTDYYKSTLHELTHLYPLLSKNGILIIDDYGMYQGSRKATDEYIAQKKLKLFLNRVNDAVRLAVKP